MTRDNRPRILEQAFADTSLGYHQRVYMFVVCTVRAQYVDGKLRHGSKAMSPDGKFTLHIDYIAGAMGTTDEAVRKIQRDLKKAGYLDSVYHGRFGRPSTWHALLGVRGAQKLRLTDGPGGTPYGMAEWFVRHAQEAPLTYRTPQEGDHAPKPGGLRPAGAESKAAATSTVAGSVCPCHWQESCPDGVDTSDRRTA